jgi:hypothetical protein
MIRVCDSCDAEIPDNGGARVTVSWSDKRRAGKKADYCDTCAATLPGETQQRRPRQSESQLAAAL